MDQAEPENIYERMAKLIYAYHFGRISYLDMLTQFEEMLGLVPPQTDQQPAEDVSPVPVKTA